jgi:hypothetical protein
MEDVSLNHAKDKLEELIERAAKGRGHPHYRCKAWDGWAHAGRRA